MASNPYSISETTPSLWSNKIPKALIFLKAEESFLHLCWQSSPTAAELAECAGYLSSVIKEQNITQLLHDVRQVDCGPLEVQRCLARVFCPPLMAAGIAKMVHLVPDTLPDLLIIDQIIDYVKQKYGTARNLKLEICTTPEGAREWFTHVSGEKPVPVALPEETNVIGAAPPVAVLPDASFRALVKAYQEKITLLDKILFPRKYLSSD